MQRIGNLYEKVISFDNLLLAYRKARKGTRLNNENARFSFHLETELLQLQTDLATETYQPQPYRYFTTYDPKTRTISIAAFVDRVVHHAIVKIIEPIFEPTFIDQSYATRKNKGTHKAIDQAQRYLQANTWFLKSDIQKYFDSIVHAKLLELIRQKIKDPQLMRLISKILNNAGTTGKGLPIGNLTSQFFANIYLNRFDHFVKQTLKCKYYLRYMDDFVIFDNDKEVLKLKLKLIVKYLTEELQLELKPTATLINQQSNGLGFLGMRIFPSIIRVRTANLRRISRRIMIKKHEYETGETEIDVYEQSLNSYWAFLSYHGNIGLRKKIIEKLDL